MPTPTRNVWTHRPTPSLVMKLAESTYSKRAIFPDGVPLIADCDARAWSLSGSRSPHFRFVLAANSLRAALTRDRLGGQTVGMSFARLAAPST
jgi:hypothetical protein